eukprot:1825852-Prymnesium_polylepis.1
MRRRQRSTDGSTCRSGQPPRTPAREHRRRPGPFVTSDDADVSSMHGGEFDPTLSSTLGVPAH